MMCRAICPGFSFALFLVQCRHLYYPHSYPNATVRGGILIWTLCQEHICAPVLQGTVRGHVTAQLRNANFPRGR